MGQYWSQRYFHHGKILSKGSKVIFQNYQVILSRNPEIHRFSSRFLSPHNLTHTSLTGSMLKIVFLPCAQEIKILQLKIEDKPMMINFSWPNVVYRQRLKLLHRLSWTTQLTKKTSFRPSEWQTEHSNSTLAGNIAITTMSSPIIKQNNKITTNMLEICWKFATRKLFSTSNQYISCNATTLTRDGRDADLVKLIFLKMSCRCIEHFFIVILRIGSWSRSVFLVSKVLMKSAVQHY